MDIVIIGRGEVGRYRALGGLIACLMTAMGCVAGDPAPQEGPAVEETAPQLDARAAGEGSAPVPTEGEGEPAPAQPTAEGEPTPAPTPAPGAENWGPSRTVGGLHAGPGRSFTWGYGGHADDFPGPGAVIAPASVPGRTLTLVGPLGDPCAVEGPAAVVLRRDAEVLDGVLRGASLVVMDPARAGGPRGPGAPHRAVHDFAIRRHLAVHSAVPAPPSLAGVTSVAATARLVRWTSPPSPELRTLAHVLLREHGQRPVLDVPPGGLSDAALAEALVDGAVLWLEGPLPERQAALVSLARRERSWFARYAPDVVLLVPADGLWAGGTRAAALSAWLLRAAAELDRSHLHWRVLLMAGGQLVPPRDSSLLRPSDLALITPPASLMSPQEQGDLARQLPGLQVISEEPVAAAPPRPGFEPIAVSRLDAGTLRAALVEFLARPERLDAALVTALPPASLPPDLRLRRFSDLARGRTVLHLLGEDAGGHELEVAGVGGAACEARAIHPWTGLRQPLGCEPVPEAPGFARVTTPPIAGWLVVEVDRVPDTAGALHPRPWTVQASPGGGLEGRTVTLELPPGGPLSQLSLSLPEWLKAEPDLSGVLDGATARVRPGPEGRSVETTMAGPGIRFVSRVDGRPQGVDIEISVSNRSEQTWHDVQALICASATDRRGEWPFPVGGTEELRARFDGELRPLSDARIDSGDPFYLELRGADVPVTELSSVDGSLTLALGMDRSDIVGGNANGGVCLHARPRFGDLEPGATATVSGRLRLEARRPNGLFDVEWALHQEPRRIQPLRDPWASPCSAEGTAVREEARPRPPAAPPG